MFRWLFSRNRNGPMAASPADHENGGIKLPVIDPSEALAPHAGRLDVIWRAVRLSEESRPELFDAPLASFAEHALNLPASRAYHDAGAGGLLEHTLKTAERAVETSADLPLVIPRDHPLLVRYQERYRAYLAFLAALLHDLGKVFALRVSPLQARGAAVLAPEWDPMAEPLASFLGRHRARQYVARFEPLEEGEHHEALGLLLAHRILSPAIIATATRRGALSVLSFLLRGVRVQTDHDALPFQPQRTVVDRPVEAAVTAADRLASSLAAAPQPSEAPSATPRPSVPADEHAVSNRRRLEILLEELRRTIRGGGFQVNSPAGHVQCGARFTFVSLSGPLHTAATRANERMRAEHLQGIVQNERHSLLFSLLARTGATHATGSQTRKVVFRANIGSQLSNVGGVLFPNETLWQDPTGPSDFPGVTAEPCEFFVSGKTESGALAMEPVPGFLSSRRAASSFRAALTRLSKSNGKSSAHPDGSNPEPIVLDRLVLLCPSGTATENPLAPLASLLHLYLADAEPVRASLVVLPRSLIPAASKVEPVRGHFRFVPCEA